MTIIKYKIFASSEDFVEWQKKGEAANICDITPLVSGIDFDSMDTNAPKGETKVAVFVVYTGKADAKGR